MTTLVAAIEKIGPTWGDRATAPTRVDAARQHQRQEAAYEHVVTPLANAY